MVETGEGNVKLQSPVLPDTVPAVTQLLPDQYCTVAPARLRPEEPQVLPVSMAMRPMVCGLLQVYWNQPVPGEVPAKTQQ